jgi:DNA-directed RNA polymerase alpha subunit
VTKPRCGKCRFWVEGEHVGQPEQGRCHRNAPQCVPPILGDDDELLHQLEGRWPITAANEWCGEFRPDGAADLDRLVLEKSTESLNVSIRTREILKDIQQYHHEIKTIGQLVKMTAYQLFATQARMSDAKHAVEELKGILKRYGLFFKGEEPE